MEQLGIDGKLLVVQIVNFLLLLFILKKVLYKPLLTAIEKRQEKLAEIDRKSKSIAAETEKSEKDRKALLVKMESERKDILEKARLEAERKAKGILENANTKAKEVLKNASKQAEREMDKASKEIDKRVQRLAAAYLSDSLSDLLSEKAKKESIDMAIKKLGKIKFEA
jgi:F-type H+-transporting ATPase subunit b